MLDSTTINQNCKPENLHIAKYEGVIVDAICSQAFYFEGNDMSEFRRKAPLCKCGCRQFVQWNKWHNKWNKYIKGHSNKNKDKYAEEKAKPAPLCACGCGKKTKWNQREKRWKGFVIDYLLLTIDYYYEIFNQKRW